MASRDSMEDIKVEADSAILESHAREADEVLMVTFEDFAGIQIWDKNCNPYFGDKEKAIISPNRLWIDFFLHIREFIDRSYIPIISPSVGRKRKHIVVEPDEDSETKASWKRKPTTLASGEDSEGEKSNPGQPNLANQQDVEVSTRRKHTKKGVYKKKKNKVNANSQKPVVPQISMTLSKFEEF